MTRNLREEVNIAPYVDRGVIDIHDKAVRDNINTFLNGALGQSFLTPYIALESSESTGEFSYSHPWDTISRR